MTIDEAIEIICDEYCKYPDIEVNVNRLADICDACPFNKMQTAEQTEPQYYAEEQREHDILYEPTYDLDDGSM